MACVPQAHCVRQPSIIPGVFGTGCTERPFIVVPCRTGERILLGHTEERCRRVDNAVFKTVQGKTRCFCKDSFCYDAEMHVCVPMALDCNKGTHPQQQRCEEERRNRHSIQNDALDITTGNFSILDKQGPSKAPCKSIGDDRDDRIMNLAAAVHLRNERVVAALARLGKPDPAREPGAAQVETMLSSKEVETHMSFYAEVVTSAANLFVRTVQDVQAMFNIYFANDPSWDGMCSLLGATFQNFHEFPAFKRKRQIGTYSQHSREYIHNRVAEGSTVVKEGEIMQDLDNPWCNHNFASPNHKQSKRIQFVRRTPPRGLTGFWAPPPRLLHGTMYPLLWCELLDSTHEQEAKEQIEEFQQKSTPGYDAPSIWSTRGWSVHFKAACTQLKLVEIKDRRGRVDGSFKVWRRYDCERSVLNRQFVVLFPRFIDRVNSILNQLGDVLEDTLQCSGRLEWAHRQYKEWALDTQVCDVTVEDILTVRSQPQIAKQRLELLASKADAAMAILRNWFRQLEEDVPQEMIEDYNKLFRHGRGLHGRAFNHLGRFWTRYGSEKAIASRLEEARRAVVSNVWENRGNLDLSFFLVPVRFKTTLSVGLASQLRNFCEVALPATAEVSVSSSTFGNTYSAEVDRQACGSLMVAPFDRLEVQLEGCLRHVNLPDGTSTWEVIWEIGLNWILHRHEEGHEKTKKKMSLFSALEAKRDDNPLEALQEYRAGSSYAWHMASKRFLDHASLPFDFDIGSIKAGVLRIKDGIVDSAKSTAQHWFNKVVSEDVRTWLSSVVAATERTAYYKLETRLRFTRRANQESWRSSVQIGYERARVMDLHVSLPGAGSFRAVAHVALRYDLSEPFVEMYSFLSEWLGKLARLGRSTEPAPPVYAQCVGCFHRGMDHQFFLCPEGKVECTAAASRDVKEACEEVSDVLQCTELFGKKGAE